MQEKVLEYLEEQRRKREEKKTVAEKWEKEERESKLLELGLWTAEYAPEGEETKAIRNAYPQRDETGRHYRKVAISVTEEEWAAIQAAAAADSDIAKVKAFGERWKNPVSRILWLTAVVFFMGGGILACLCLLFVVLYNGGWEALMGAVRVVFLGGMGGLALMSAAEIIQLLDKTE